MTVCTDLTSLIGVTCYPLSDDGSVAMLDTSFKFADGDDAPVFVEKTAGQVRFFDDGGVLLHFAGRGVRIESLRNVRFIQNLSAAYGVKLNDDGELELWANERDAPAAFANYVSTLVALTAWERDQQGVASDLTLLIDEVEMCLRAIDPAWAPVPRPEYVGVSGQRYHLDFDFNGSGVIAITPHKLTVSSAIRKLLDIKSKPDNMGFEALIILDDRADPDGAKSEGRVLDAVGRVWPMTRLEQQAGFKGLTYGVV
ncbi:DUF1828 domain-containing protein [Variovorax ureilyticus]|uniref:DUF1828 domain-containing protein n=1 Tax=Variovorax ureilyticus TaxID=1836198 RepID=A0ABU8VCR1_9BURK